MKPRRWRIRQGDQGCAQEQDMSEMTKFGADLIQSMMEALAHAQGKDVAGVSVRDVDVGAVDAKPSARSSTWRRTRWRPCWEPALPATRNGSKASGSQAVPLAHCSVSWIGSQRPCCAPCLPRTWFPTASSLQPLRTKQGRSRGSLSPTARSP